MTLRSAPALLDCSALCLLVLLGGCASGSPASADAGSDAGFDSGPDASADGGLDAGPDAGADAGSSPDGPPLINASLHNTVLGRPTDRSIAISVLASPGDKAWAEYSMQTDAAQTALVGASATAAVSSGSGEPIVLEVGGLAADTKYYYRLRYQAGLQGESPDALHSFRTQRAQGRSYHFGVQGDTHPERSANKMFHAELFTLTMQQVRDRQPDLYFLLGDDFSIEDAIQTFKDANYGAGYGFRRSVEGSASYGDYLLLAHPFLQPMVVDGVSAPHNNAAYQLLRQQYLGLVANATSLFLVNGNHEQAHSASLGGVFNNSAVWAADGRLKYYPLPAPGTFYTGDAQPLAARNGYPTIAAPDGLLRDYYAFIWGDALFVTIDPYWHSDEMPESTLYNGDATTKKDLWKATMGDQQYAWLKQTLESSTAKWKFIFTHHINGTGRGAASNLGLGEWGASVADMKANRPTWPKSVHQLLVDTKVTIFFQAHDHMFSRELIDGVVYQEVPNPADNSYFAYNCDAYGPASIAWPGPVGYGVYDPAYSVRMPNTGFLDVKVSPSGVHVDYIRTYRPIDLQTNPNKIFTGKEVNGEVAFSYSVPAQSGDDLAKDFTYTCIGAAPPSTWIYNP